MTMAVDDLYLDQLQDMHSCEQQLVEALPKMADAASHPALRTGFTKQLEETKEQLERLNRILTDLGKTPGRKVCEATLGLITEDGDAGLICAAQRIEHYEIASYGCLRFWAHMLGRSTDVQLLDQSLNEEQATDLSLTALAVSVVNRPAIT